MRATKPHVCEPLVTTDFSRHADHAFHLVLARRLVARFRLCQMVHKRGDPAHDRRHVALVSLD